jgi:hypothetical protein
MKLFLKIISYISLILGIVIAIGIVWDSYEQNRFTAIAMNLRSEAIGFALLYLVLDKVDFRKKEIPE